MLAERVARRPRVLPLASITYHLRLISFPLGMVVDICVYSLNLPSSVFGVVHEEGRTNGWCTCKQNCGASQAGRRHVEVGLLGVTRNAYGMGASGATVLKVTPSGSI